MMKGLNVLPSDPEANDPGYGWSKPRQNAIFKHKRLHYVELINNDPNLSDHPLHKFVGEGYYESEARARAKFIHRYADALFSSKALDLEFNVLKSRLLRNLKNGTIQVKVKLILQDRLHSKSP